MGWATGYVVYYPVQVVSLRLEFALLEAIR
jgi:hypothetical protein